KFGGSSVGTPERVLQVVDILKTDYTAGEPFTVVFSAFGGVTDSLIDMSRLAAGGEDRYGLLFEEFANRHQEAIEKLIAPGDIKEETIATIRQSHEVLKNILYGIFLVREASPRTLDYVLSFGERSSAYIIAQTLEGLGIPAEFLDARKIIKTDKNFGAAQVDFDLTFSRIKDYYAEHPKVQVVTGFVASARGGLTTTLGRGGSDYTASILAAGLRASCIEIWTDVQGVLTADPRRVEKALTIPELTYAEAMEMSHFGAKVIYPPTLLPATKLKIPLFIKNTFDPQFEGTRISSKTKEEGTAVRGISSINSVALLTLSGSGLFGVPGIAARLFNSMALAEINIILITQGSSEHSISFAVKPELANRAQNSVRKEFDLEIERGIVNEVRVERDLSVVAIIGENMRYEPGIAARMFQALGNNGINAVAIAQGSSELNISVVIGEADETKALNALHESFFLSDVKTLHLFIVGVGLIGGTLLKQIESQNAYLREHRGMEIKVVALANTKKMVFDSGGIPLNSWRNRLDESDTEVELSVYIRKMNNLNLSNTIFIDNTADPRVASFYESILNESISISTPNKVATSSSYLQYQRLRNIATKRGVQFMYETNVGAGLPIISTLRDLMDSGDEVQSIEGVLSGSLSFIFNQFDGNRPFHEVVAEAKGKGYTEPDPRIDLSGQDVKRKILILSRESGFELEPDQVEVHNFLPDEVMNAETVEEFFERLENAADYFDNLLNEAKQAGKILRMLASYKDGKATVGLTSVSIDSPFASLNGSDNMIVFKTARYQDRPLVVTGPGAGAEVTAAGVFSEIIRIGNYLS
ncbi:MAG: bifunctional aspartate kinase/homoserine dehydrogenase I, partial [Bacteroidota bacterium]